MIDFYTWFTPNGRKVSIMLEECGLDYTTHAVNIGKDEQFDPAFLKISPNNKIPAIVDRDNGRSLMESGAILMYLAEKSGKFWPQDPDGKWKTVEWLMFQMGGVGPIFGQVHHFERAAKEDVPYGKKRYGTECRRLYAVMDAHLEGKSFFANDEYSIADIAILPWVARYEWQHVDLADYPNVKRWFDSLMARPAVQRGMEIPAG
ncbi:glutathione S-transferase N-terminal domain-containing protein [Thalassobaculum sp.]|uniref:glutathione S-transferase family protein n=1 Tax=Thalassobaculum sp. TaxID=2022740 RepID=UPI0032EDA9F0